jgi:D-arabinitol dehydrogenase (NADP+)
MDLAKSLDAGDEYVALSRSDPSAQFEKLKKENPYGFDIVVEATGSVKILEDSINYVRRGGKLVVYGVYNNEARVSWPPSKICKYHLPSCRVIQVLIHVYSWRRDHHPRKFLRDI